MREKPADSRGFEEGFDIECHIEGASLLDDDDEKMSELEEGSDDPDAALV